jgi:hypothetical protein
MKPQAVRIMSAWAIMLMQFYDVLHLMTCPLALSLPAI